MKLLLVLLVAVAVLVWFCFDFDSLDERPTPLHVGHGSKKGLYKTDAGTYLKSWHKMDAGRYLAEKTCYLLLQDSVHVPRLIAYDDDKLEIEIENAGTPLNVLADSGSLAENDIPDWRDQVHDIIRELRSRGICHGDWHGGNLTNDGGVIKVIDFEGASYLEDRQSQQRVQVAPTRAQTLVQYLDSLKYWERRKKKK